MNEAARYALLQLGDAFRQFARNGRWGTCADCQRDSDGRAYPEFCEHTKRYDHQLTVESLAETWRNYERAAGHIAEGTTP